MKNENFKKKEFMEYLEETFVGYKGMEGGHLRELVDNLVDFAMEHMSKTRDDVAHFLSGIIPELTFGEVAMFMDESELTEHGRRERTEAMKRLLTQ